MRVLVAGASGFLGRSVVRGYVAAGHEVRGLVRTPERAERVVSVGGIPVLGDLLNPDRLEAALEGCDVAVHLAQPSDGGLEAMRRVRVEGARHLVAAAERQGVRRIVVGSGYWVYQTNPGLVTEESPLEPRSISRVNFETESVVRESGARGRFEHVIARPGMVYGNGSWFAEMVREIRAGTYRYIGDGANFLSPVDLPDTGDAFRILGERGQPGATYLVVDDQPVTTRAFAEFVAERLGAAAPRSIPFEEAAGAWGEDLALLNAASRRASNAKLRRLGWEPQSRTFREGIPSVLAEMSAT